MDLGLFQELLPKKFLSPVPYPYDSEISVNGVQPSKLQIPYSMHLLHKADLLDLVIRAQKPLVARLRELDEQGSKS
ncbi:hypothetical protein TNIN_60901, partial [Trichonephila inaurata madagascariensis]